MKRNHKVLKCVSLIVASIFACSFFAADSFIDPTRPLNYENPLATPQQNNSDFTLNAIIIHPRHRLAIINHQQVMVGDKLGEFTITSITPYAVELIGPEDKKQVLQLVAPVKQPR